MPEIDFDKDPEFVAGYTKAQFVQDIHLAMEETGIDKDCLGDRLGKSRRSINRILNEDASFSVTQMAAISCALGRKLSVRMSK